MTIPTCHNSNGANADALREVARWIQHDKAFVESHDVRFDNTSLTVTVRLEGERRLLG